MTVRAAQDLGDPILGWELISALPVMLLVALLAGRLLGVRRSVGSAAVSRVIGWLAGASLSLVIASHEGGGGFTRNLWLFSHPGNLLVLAGGRLGLIDFGATGRLDPLQPSSLREMVLAISQRDASLDRSRGRHSSPRVRRRAAPAGPGPVHGPQPGAGRGALGGHVQRAAPGVLLVRGHPPARVQHLLPCPRHPRRHPHGPPSRLPRDRRRPGGRPGVGARPHHARHPPRDGPPGAALPGAHAAAPSPPYRPPGGDRGTGRRAGQREFRDAEDVRVVSRLVNRVVLAFLGGVVGVISVVLLGVGGGPPFTGDTSLYEFFGYVGLFCGTVLVLRVLVAVVREGVN